MLVRHATPRRNVTSIMEHGLLVSKATGKLKAVWFHQGSLTGWAMVHVSRRHKADVSDVVVLTCSVPDGWLTRSRRGLWHCRRDVPPARICEVLDYSSEAETPVEVS